MRLNEAISSERFRRVLSLAAFTLLLVITSLSAGCGGGGGTGDGGGGGPVVPPRPGAALGDTPIVISGGSTEIEMDNQTFKPVSGNKFSSTDAGKFQAVIVYDDAENAKDEDLITFAIPASGKCSVILKHKDGTITMSNENSDKIEVEFDTARIKPRLRTPNGKALQHFSRKMKLEGIEVKTGGSAVVCQNFQGINTPCKLPGGKFTVEVWFQ